jgi:type I restriction enzyme S subunit
MMSSQEVPQGYKKTKVGVIPLEWEVVKLQEVTSYVDYRGKTPKKVSNGIILVTARNIKQGYLDYETSKEYIDEDDYHNVMSRGMPQLEDVLLTTEAPLGNIAQIDNENIALAQRVIKFRGKDNLDNRYLKYHFLSEKFQQYLYRLAIGTTVLGIQGKQLHKMLIPLPPLKEQQKIAKILTTWDDAISKQEELIKAKEQLKIGLMQKLLSGEVRFDGFNNEWEEVRLGNLCKIAKSGGTPTSSNKVYYDGNIPFLAISDITKQGKYLTYTSKKISQIGLDNSASWIVPINTIIYSMYASVGFVSINKIPIATSQAVINLILKDNISLEYIYYYLLDYKKYIHKYIETGTQGNLNAQIVKNLRIKLPSLHEQQKIAKVLSTADKEIELLKNELEELKKQKKGLMQRLLTGEVRVNV